MFKKKLSFSSSVSKRLYLLFAFAAGLLLILIGRLGYMQVVNKEFYTKKLATASKTKVTIPSVRGEIFDAAGKPLVTNTSRQVVSFTRSNTMTGADLKKIAQGLVNLVTLSDVTVTERQEIDYYLADAATYKKVVDALPRDKRLTSDGNNLEESKIYNNAVASVKTSDLNYSDEDKKAIYLFNQLNSVANFATGNLTTDPLTPDQAATIAASGKEMPGISISTSWDRTMSDTSLAAILGSVSTEAAGLPAEEADEYLKKGYSLNDRVGTSYLEKQYEDQLQGKRAVKEIHLDKSGDFESITNVSNGEKGKNLKLTINSDFQSGVESILRNYFTSELARGTATYSEGTYAVAINPTTGAVLAMAGIKHDTDTGELSSDALGAFTNVVVPGSVVKGATLTAGWETGAISGNQVLTDQPMIIDGLNVINSWFTPYGNRNITAVQALEYSSNTYMVQIALNMMGSPYGSGKEIDMSKLNSSMEKLRATFAEYGMGTQTGIDLPNEGNGFIPQKYNFGNYITNAFGQFDNYTPLQLAQYAATVANGGTRIAPHLVEGIYSSKTAGQLGDLVEEIKPKELNKVNISSDDMDLIHEGFYDVVHGTSGFTTGATIRYGESVPISAKTGTAETFVTTKSGEVQNAINTNVVAYAPSSNPQIAVAVVFPHDTDLNASVSHSITRDIINLYMSQQQ